MLSDLFVFLKLLYIIIKINGLIKDFTITNKKIYNIYNYTYSFY